MIGNWFFNYIGKWFGYDFEPPEPGTDPDFLCKPELVMYHDKFETELVEELTMTWEDDNFYLSQEDCPII